MLEAGITDGSLLHTIHLWPVDKRQTNSAKKLRLRFYAGKKWHQGTRSRLTIHDIPPGANVVLHGGLGLTLSLTRPNLPN